jgi:hypothetical protein
VNVGDVMFVVIVVHVVFLVFVVWSQLACLGWPVLGPCQVSAPVGWFEAPVRLGLG